MDTNHLSSALRSLDHLLYDFTFARNFQAQMRLLSDIEHLIASYIREHPEQRNEVNQIPKF